MMTFADLFAGCGGLSHGFYTRGFRPLMAVDHWDAAAETYALNHPTTPYLVMDLLVPANRKRVVHELRDTCDILLGGPPCQGFSTLGKRRDEDVRNTLTDAFADIALAVRPKIIIIENVRGIGSKLHPSGLSYAAALRAALSSGAARTRYNIAELLIDALDFGLAQTRKRWLLVAVRSDLDYENQLVSQIVAGIERRSRRKPATLRAVIGDLPRIEAGEGGDVLAIPRGRQTQMIYNHKAMKHTQSLVNRLACVPVDGGLQDVPRRLLTPHLRRMLDGAYGSGGHVKNVYGRLSWEKPCGTIVAGMDKITCGRYVHPEANRLLTPRECARIQSFPDAFRFVGSQVTQYYLIGNAVPPAISAALAGSIAVAFGTQSPLENQNRVLKDDKVGKVA